MQLTLICNTTVIDKWVAGMARILSKFSTTEVNKNCHRGSEALMTGTGHPGSRMEVYKSFMEPFREISSAPQGKGCNCLNIDADGV